MMMMMMLMMINQIIRKNLSENGITHFTEENGKRDSIFR